MKSNITKHERLLRMTFGIMVVGYGVIHQNFMGMLGVLPLLSGLFGWCPMYAFDKNKNSEKIKL